MLHMKYERIAHVFILFVLHIVLLCRFHTFLGNLQKLTIHRFKNSKLPMATNSTALFDLFHFYVLFVCENRPFLFVFIVLYTRGKLATCSWVAPILSLFLPTYILLFVFHLFLFLISFLLPQSLRNCCVLMHMYNAKIVRNAPNL